jgi:hypothetical protein
MWSGVRGRHRMRRHELYPLNELQTVAPGR